MIVRYIIGRNYISKAPLQWPTATVEAIYVGHDNDVVPAQAWSPNITLLTFPKMMRGPIAGLGCRTCMLGSHPIQQMLKRHIHERRGCNIPQPARVDVMVERENVENTRYWAGHNK